MSAFHSARGGVRLQKIFSVERRGLSCKIFMKKLGFETFFVPMAPFFKNLQSLLNRPENLFVKFSHESWNVPKKISTS